jgi:MEMO1 family protein
MRPLAVRKPAVAGMFYPDDPCELHEMITAFMHEAKASGSVPKAIIAPHAGYVYSGAIAASVYALVAPAKGKIKRVVLLGPSHRVPFRGLAATSAEHFETPLGRIEIDREAIASIADMKQVQVLDQAHAAEHSLEVQLPFLQEILGEFKLVPLCVGDAAAQDVGEVIEKLWGGPETLIVVSSDLSHYHQYKTARRMDEATSKAIEGLHPDDIDYEQACGRIPVSGLLVVAQKKGLHARTVDLRNSGDTAGSKDQVVGYGAYAFEQR